MKRSAKIGSIRCFASIKTPRQLTVIQKKLDTNGALRRINQYCSILSDPTRSKIALALFIERDLCVCDLANILGISVAAVSQHLKKMKGLHLISAKRKGLTLYYFFRNNRFKKFLTHFLKNELQILR